MDEFEHNGTGWKLAIILSNLFAGVAMGVVAWMLLTIVDVDKRVAMMEGNRFTVQDGYSLQSNLNSAITSLTETITRLGEPPQWMLDQMREQDQRIDNLERDVREMRAQK